MKGIRNWVLAGAMVLALPLFASTNNNNVDRTTGDLNKKVRHELLMLPYFTIFDNLNYQVVNGDTVVLSGTVTRPVLKSDAGNVVKQIRGVEQVVNNIEVLPLSRFDDQIRLATARAIYGYGPLNRYGMGTQPSIRIIVKNGNVTLEGFVDNEGDKNLINMRANQVPGVFSVTNELKVPAKS